jgi:hypothetical protein
MKTVYWIIAIIVALPILWFLLKLLVSLMVPPEKSGRELLKQSIRAYGVDVSRIPDSALNELVERNIRTSKTIASFSGDPNRNNWRANLVRALEAEGSMIAAIMDGERGNNIKEFDAWKTLVRHGVIKE